MEVRRRRDTSNDADEALENLTKYIQVSPSDPPATYLLQHPKHTYLIEAPYAGFGNGTKGARPTFTLTVDAGKAA